MSSGNNFLLYTIIFPLGVRRPDGAVSFVSVLMFFFASLKILSARVFVYHRRDTDHMEYAR